MSFTVEFKKSGKKLPWDDKYESLLEMAEENGVEIEYQCREGYCGECKTRLISGDVKMEDDSGLEDTDEGMILPCVSRPKTDIVLDA